MLKKLEEQETKLDAVHASVEKLRKYFLWTMWITIITIVLPLVVLVLILPWFVSTMSSTYNLGGLGL